MQQVVVAAQERHESTGDVKAHFPASPTDPKLEHKHSCTWGMSHTNPLWKVRGKKKSLTYHPFHRCWAPRHRLPTKGQFLSYSWFQSSWFHTSPGLGQSSGIPAWHSLWCRQEKNQINENISFISENKNTSEEKKNFLNLTSNTEVKIEHSPFRIHFTSYDITSSSTHREYFHIPIPSTSRWKISNIHLSQHSSLSQGTVSRKGIGSELSPSVSANVSMTVRFDSTITLFPLKAVSNPMCTGPRSSGSHTVLSTSTKCTTVLYHMIQYWTKKYQE